MRSKNYSTFKYDLGSLILGNSRESTFSEHIGQESSLSKILEKYKKLGQII